MLSELPALSLPLVALSVLELLLKKLLELPDFLALVLPLTSLSALLLLLDSSETCVALLSLDECSSCREWYDHI